MDLTPNEREVLKRMYQRYPATLRDWEASPSTLRSLISKGLAEKLIYKITPLPGHGGGCVEYQYRATQIGLFTYLDKTFV